MWFSTATGAARFRVHIAAIFKNGWSPTVDSPFSSTDPCTRALNTLFPKNCSAESRAHSRHAADVSISDVKLISLGSQRRTEVFVWEAVKIDGRQRARDPENGALVWLRSTAEIDDQQVVVKLPGEDELFFTVTHTPPSAEIVVRSSDARTLKLFAYDFQSIIKKRSRSFDENTRFVRYLIEGLATINRKWPLCEHPRFYSDFEEFKRRGIAPEFVFPSDEELARL